MEIVPENIWKILEQCEAEGRLLPFRIGREWPFDAVAYHPIGHIESVKLSF